MSANQYQLVEAAKKVIVTTAEGEIIRISESAAIRAVLNGAKTVTDVVHAALAECALAAV